MTNTYNLKLFCDGGSRGNPGPAAYGSVIYDHAGNILEKCGNYLGVATNNQAEYEGLIAGVRFVTEHYPGAHLDITMDSLLIVNQVKGLYKVKNPGLLLKYHEVKLLLSRVKSYTISHTYRSDNSLADSLVNQALDSQSQV